MFDNFERTYGRTDDDGRTPEDAYTISSTCEPDGLGGLKSYTHVVSFSIDQKQQRTRSAMESPHSIIIRTVLLCDIKFPFCGRCNSHYFGVSVIVLCLGQLVPIHLCSGQGPIV